MWKLRAPPWDHAGPWLLADLGAGSVAGGELAGRFLGLLWGPGLCSSVPAYMALPENLEGSWDRAWWGWGLAVWVQAVRLGPSLAKMPSVALLLSPEEGTGA